MTVLEAVFDSDTGESLAEILARLFGLMSNFDGRLTLILDSLFNGLTANPFLVTFEDLDGAELVSGVWNKPLARLEC